MRKFTVCIVVLCTALCICCKRYKKEKPDYNSAEASHERLDKRALPLLENKENYVLKSGDTVISWIKHRWFYEEYKRIGNSAFYNIKQYDSKNLNIVYECRFFQNAITIGYEKEYDDDGNLEKKQNLSAEFKFTIDSLIGKMKKEYNVDLAKQLKLPEKVERMNHRQGHGVWLRYIVVKKIGRYYHKIEIDGQKGYIIKDKIVYIYTS